MQIAAHEDIVPVEKLYEICQNARKILTGPYAVARVIARPFTGTSGNYTRTKNRRDFSLEPTGETILDVISTKGEDVIAIGKNRGHFPAQRHNFSRPYNKTITTA